VYKHEQYTVSFTYSVNKSGPKLPFARWGVHEFVRGLKVLMGTLMQMWGLRAQALVRTRLFGKGEGRKLEPLLFPPLATSLK